MSLMLIIETFSLIVAFKSVCAILGEIKHFSNPLKIKSIAHKLDIRKLHSSNRYPSPAVSDTPLSLLLSLSHSPAHLSPLISGKYVGAKLSRIRYFYQIRVFSRFARRAAEECADKPPDVVGRSVIYRSLFAEINSERHTGEIAH